MHKRGEMKSYYKGRTKKFIDYVLGTEGVVSLMIESNKMCDPCSWYQMGYGFCCCYFAVWMSYK